MPLRIATHLIRSTGDLIMHHPMSRLLAVFVLALLAMHAHAQTTAAGQTRSEVPDRRLPPSLQQLVDRERAAGTLGSLQASPSGNNEYICATEGKQKTCSCFRAKDCVDMYLSDVCANEPKCEKQTENTYCECNWKQ
jgi:hypothetical protein